MNTKNSKSSYLSCADVAGAIGAAGAADAAEIAEIVKDLRVDDLYLNDLIACVINIFACTQTVSVRGDRELAKTLAHRMLPNSSTIKKAYLYALVAIRDSKDPLEAACSAGLPRHESSILIEMMTK